MERKSNRAKSSVKNNKSNGERRAAIKTRTISEARRAAFEILLKIERERAFSSVLLPVYEGKLSASDRALCHALTLGVLRNRIYLDRIVGEFVKTKLEKLDAEVLIALRLGIFQLRLLDKIPVFAAINESVNLVHSAKKSSASGLVNAVLRKAGSDKTFDFKFTDDIEKISIETSHPRWLVERWAGEFGTEDAAKLARINNATPASVFRLTQNSDENTVSILKKLGSEIEESENVPGAFRISKSNEFTRAYADEGKIYFQEESSQLVGLAVNLADGESFLDVCAAPGSKTTFVARQKAKGKRQKAESKILVAGDRYFHRLRVLRENCERTGANQVQIVAYDAERALPFADESFDCVLIDAPCSGTGTIRHNPEIKYFLKPTDFAELAAKQLRILENASKAAKRGGRLIYSTCSLERAENEDVIERFLAQNSDYEKVTPVTPAEFVTGENFARTFPPRDQTDGFFIAELRRS